MDGSARQRPRADVVAKRLYAYLQLPQNVVGGSLHIYTDDGNMGQGSMESCAAWAIECGDEEGYQLSMQLRSMTRTQQKRVLHLVFVFQGRDAMPGPAGAKWAKDQLKRKQRRGVV